MLTVCHTGYHMYDDFIPSVLTNMPLYIIPILQMETLWPKERNFLITTIMLQRVRAELSLWLSSFVLILIFFNTGTDLEPHAYKS